MHIDFYSSCNNVFQWDLMHTAPTCSVLNNCGIRDNSTVDKIPICAHRGSGGTEAIFFSLIL